MSAWIMIVAITLTLLAGMVLAGRLPRKTWELAAAMLAFGLTGYALQGSPDLAGSPAKAVKSGNAAGSALLELRAKMAPNFDVSKQWTITADSFASSGKYRLAAAYVESGLKKHPRNSDLWAALGLYMMLASDGKITPPAEYAFAQARKFRSRNAAPDYLEGVAALFEGRPAETVEKWTGALKMAPKQSEWEAAVQRQLDGLLEIAKQSGGGIEGPGEI
ncbi:MAG: hypothetical protein V3V15_04605 [Sphingorhabdus sp.]